jgi:hypothetical protein
MSAILPFVIRYNSGPRKACRPSCVQVHWLLPPEMTGAGSSPPPSLYTGCEDGLMDNVISYMLPLDSNIVGNSFEPSVLKNLRRVWVRPRTIPKLHWPLACHTPGGPYMKPLKKLQT